MYVRKDDLPKDDRGHVNCRGLKMGEQALSSYIHTYLVLTPSITSLNLTDNDIGDGGAADLGNYLLSNQTLGTLNLTNNRISVGGLTSLLYDIRKNKTSSLHSLYLCENNMGPECAAPIAKFLEESTKILKLNLYNNKLSDRGVKKIAESLQKNSSLTYLGLSSNKLTDLGAKYLADGLKLNKTIEKLYLHNNSITDEGAKAIHSMIMNSLDDEKKSRFKVLNLNGNRIGGGMVGMLKNDFAPPRILLLDLELQKPVEADATKVEVVEVEKKEVPKSGSKSPRSKRKTTILKKKHNSSSIPTNELLFGEDSEGTESASNHKSRSSKVRTKRGGQLDSDESIFAEGFNAKRAKAHNKCPNDDEYFSGDEMRYTVQINSNVNDPQQLRRLLLQAEYHNVVLQAALKKKKLQLANTRKLLELEKMNTSSSTTIEPNELILQLEFTKKRLAESEQRQLDTEIELFQKKKELEELQFALQLANSNFLKELNFEESKKQ